MTQLALLRLTVVAAALSLASPLVVRAQDATAASDGSLRWWIPVASHADGANDSRWRTDLGVLNRGSVAATVEARLHLPSGVVSGALATTGTGVQEVFEDVVGQLGAAGSGALELVSDQPILVSSRTYNESATGTFGQGLGPFSAGDSLEAGARAYLLQLAEDERFRTNLAISNGGGTTARAAVELFSCAGELVHQYELSAAPGRWVQSNRPFFTLAGRSDISCGFARLELLAGSLVTAYASVVDAGTNDPTTIPWQPEPSARVLWVPVASHAVGANDSQWRTDLSVLNPAGASSALELRLHTPAGVLSQQTVAPAASQLLLGDVVTLFGFTGSASLEVVSELPVSVMSRTYNQSASGTFGQELAAWPEGSGLATGQEAILPQLAENHAFRSNVAFTNTGDTDAVVLVELCDGAGNTVRSFSVPVPARQWRQENRPFFNRAGLDDLDRGHARVRVDQGAGVVAYASVVDAFTNDPTTVDMRPVATAAAVIGPQGGSVVTGGFQLKVAAGATDSTSLVEVVRSARRTDFGAAQSSEVYEVLGMAPDELGGSIIRIRPTSGIGEGTPFVVLEERVFVPSAAGELAKPMLLEASVDGDQLVVTLPVPDGPLPEKGGTRSSFSLWSIAGYHALISASGAFRVVYPVSVVSFGAAEDIADALDAARSRSAGIGIDWSLRSSSPIDVEIAPFGADGATRLAEAVPSRLGDNYYWIHLNADRLHGAADVPSMAVAAGHELLHLAQSLYDHRSRVVKARNPGPWYWLDEATAVWFESVIHPSPTHLPDVVQQQYWRLTRHALEYPPGDYGEVQDHGYGAALFVRYLAGRYGETAIGDIIRAKAGWASPVDAVNTSADFRVGSAWRFFAERLGQGTVFGTPFPQPANLVYLASDNTYAFDADEATGTTFRWDAPDLSLQAYRVQFQVAGWPADSNVEIALDDPAGGSSALVYRLQGSTLDPVFGLVEPGGTFIVEHAEELAASATSLLVLVANGNGQRPYTGATPLTLTVTLDRGTEPLDTVYYRFYHTVFECDGRRWGPLNEMALVLENGVISVEADCTGNLGPDRHTASGVADENGASFSFSSVYDSTTITGTFTSTDAWPSLPGAYTYTGEVAFTFSRSGTTPCSASWVDPTQRTLMALASSSCKKR